MANDRRKRRQAKATARRASLTSTGSLEQLNVHASEVESWFGWIEHLETSELQRQTVQNLEEGLARLASKLKKLQRLRQKFPKHHRSFRGINHEQQLALFEETESFFQTFYAVLSATAGLCARFSEVFGKPPMSSMSKFVEWLNVRFEAPGHFDQLQVARAFRAILDHPEQFPPYDWKTATYNSGPMRVVLLGPTSRNGSIPPGSIRHDFADGEGWDFVAPPEEFVYTMTALAARCCLWQLAQWSRGEAMTTPIVRISTTYDPELPNSSPRNSDDWARVEAINGVQDSLPFSVARSFKTPYLNIGFGRGSLSIEEPKDGV